MKIECVEIQNFRKLYLTRIEFEAEQTLFVGANNSGKTSAMLALRYFLIDQTAFSYRDISISNWDTIIQIGNEWENKPPEEKLVAERLLQCLPTMDIWLDVNDNEIHHIVHLLPNLDWTGGLVGVRMCLEPQDIEKLCIEYLLERKTACEIAQKASEKNPQKPLEIWPNNLLEFLDKKLQTSFTINSYVLDPDKRETPDLGIARPQKLHEKQQPIIGNPWKGLIRIDEIAAQRDLTDSGANNRTKDDGHGKNFKVQRRLSEQLRAYYNRHLDPLKSPTEKDIDALLAIQSAEHAFDERLQEHFNDPFKELDSLGYPGIADPKVKLNTKLQAIDGIQHTSAVQYEIAVDSAGLPLYLPENYSGLGYQNLISMVFMLMGFRDDWMQVGKACQPTASNTERSLTPPLHLVLVEEPEAHLHAQVQQVFIKKAYELLRKHTDLRKSELLTTQLVISTHSSHIAHEMDCKCLRYFKKIQAEKTSSPTTIVANLSTIFGNADDTARFVSRYLKITHCDLFFADAAILVEGQAERILVPHFIRYGYDGRLDKRYITILELGGAHAHRFQSLIETLGLTTLIISDLDSVSLVTNEKGKSRWKSAIPEMGKQLKTANAVLKKWHPKIEDLDALMRLAPSDHEYQPSGQAPIYVAFQKPICTQENGRRFSIIPRTFEDAFVLANKEIASELGEEPLTKKIKLIVDEFKGDQESLIDKLFEALKKAEKAEFALDVLMYDAPEKVKPPPYIDDGLKWLDNELNRNNNVFWAIFVKEPSYA